MPSDALIWAAFIGGSFLVGLLLRLTGRRIRRWWRFQRSRTWTFCCHRCTTWVTVLFDGIPDEVKRGDDRAECPECGGPLAPPPMRFR